MNEFPVVKAVDNGNRFFPKLKTLIDIKVRVTKAVRKLISLNKIEAV